MFLKTVDSESSPLVLNPHLMCTCVLHTKVGFEWFLYMYACIHQWNCVGLVYHSDLWPMLYGSL